MRKTTLPLPVAALFVASLLLPLSAAAQADDPCEGEADKLTCINDLIAATEARIGARIDYLKNTAGPQGPQGVAGPQGPVGEVGPIGDDRVTSITDGIDAEVLDLRSRYVDAVRIVISGDTSIDSIFNALLTDVDDLRERFSDLNRNPALINESSIGRAATLDFPGVIGSNPKRYLTGFIRNVGSERCTTTFENNTVSTTCEPSVEPVNVESVCDGIDGLFNYDPAFCGAVADSAMLSEMTVDNIEVEMGDLAYLSTAPTSVEFEVVSMEEWASYKLGLKADDPVYLLALDRVLTTLEVTTVRDEILDALNGVVNDLDNAYVEGYRAELVALMTLPNLPQETIDEYQALYDSAYDDRDRTVEYALNAIDVTTSLASGDYGLRRERLSELAVDSDVFYFLVVQATIDNFLDYLYDPVFAANLDSAELAAMQSFEKKFDHFAEGYVERWKTLARQERDSYFQQSRSSASALWPDLNTPDFVEVAAGKTASNPRASCRERVYSVV
jgi:hypothetical protein